MVDWGSVVHGGVVDGVVDSRGSVDSVVDDGGGVDNRGVVDNGSVVDDGGDNLGGGDVLRVLGLTLVGNLGNVSLLEFEALVKTTKVINFIY